MERRLLVHALIALPLFAAALKMRGFGRLYAVLSRFAPIHPGRVAATAGVQFQRVNRTAWAVRVAATQGLVRGHCLQQSLTLWWLLRRQGLESEIRFGARRRDQNLEAHAWVEFGGVALNEGPEAERSFAPFAHAGTAGEAGGR